MEEDNSTTREKSEPKIWKIGLAGFAVLGAGYLLGNSNKDSSVSAQRDNERTSVTRTVEMPEVQRQLSLEELRKTYPVHEVTVQYPRKGILGALGFKKKMKVLDPGIEPREEYSHMANRTGPYAIPKGAKIVRGIQEPIPQTDAEAWLNGYIHRPRGFLAYSGMNRDNTDGEERRRNELVLEGVKLGLTALSIKNAYEQGSNVLEKLVESVK